MPFKSLGDINLAASQSGVTKIETSDIRILLDEKSLNSLLFMKPFSKLCFIYSTVSEFLRSGNVIYIDLDTTFTSYVRNGVFNFSEVNDLLIYTPSANEFEELLSDICSRINSDVALVIIDSLNSFYHLYDGVKGGSLNHLLSSYVSLLLDHTSRLGSRLLITSMIRQRKTTEWILVPSNRRFIETKGGVILMVDLLEGALEINLLKHRKLKISSTKMLLTKEQIPIAS